MEDKEETKTTLERRIFNFAFGASLGMTFAWLLMSIAPQPKREVVVQLDQVAISKTSRFCMLDGTLISLDEKEDNQ